MVRFGKYCVYVDGLSFFGRLCYFIHGDPHLVKFLHSHYFIRNTNKLMSEKVACVLDLACGYGDYSFYLAEKYPWLKIDAIDVNSASINPAKKIVNSVNLKNIEFICKDFGELSTDKKYDYVFCIASFHAFPNKKDALKKISLLLSANGVFYFQDSIKDAYADTFFSSRSKSFLHYQKHFVVGEQFDKQDFCEAFKEANLSVIEMKEIVGFFGMFAWGLDQILHEVKFKYAKTIAMPFLKLICLFEFLFPIGKKNDVFIVAKKGFD